VAQATRLGELTFGDHVERAIREVAMWAMMVVAVYLAVALVSYSPHDPGWSYVGPTETVANPAGPVGAWFSDVTLALFGVLAYLFPVAVAWSAYLVLRHTRREGENRLYLLSIRLLGLVLTLAAGTAFVTLHFAGLEDLGGLLPNLPNGIGGGFGRLLRDWMVAAFNYRGTSFLLTGALFVGVSLFAGVSWIAVMDAIGGAIIDGLGWVQRRLVAAGNAVVGLFRRALEDDPAGGEEPQVAEAAGAAQAEGVSAKRRRREPSLAGASSVDLGPPDSEAADVADWGEPPAAPKRRQTLLDLIPGLMFDKAQAPSSVKHPPAKAVPKARLGALADERQPPLPPVFSADQEHPPLELLDPARKSGKGYSEETLEGLSRQVETILADFGVTVRVVAVHPGPVVTLFELQLAPGIKVSKITGLAKDIARALSTVSVRVVEVIPGKSVIGLEIPNEQREIVFLSEILSAEVYQEAKSPLTLAMGSSIAGDPVVADLARMPHALIAGTTGSGKSVAINTMILSLVYKSGPKDVRLIMVDPKMLELSVYEGIPHLLTPVVTDMKEAANALRWCVGEMERRYRLMSRLGVRNIGGYNRKVAEAEEAGEPIPDPTWVPADAGAFGEDGFEPPMLGHLPYIVVIIDELADMMMVVGKKVEELIARLAQKARASGIHLLLATQRPSVDVLTGLIKANIPTRIAFQVSARVDSRTVLDQMGAEQLLGHGDMLYLPPGTSIPQRVHGAFVDDHEVHRVVSYLKQLGKPDYIKNILQDPGEPIPGIDPEPRGGDVEDQDPLFDEAVAFVVESRRASISGVQRRFKIGYNRAARMVEEMERIGLVGAAETNGNREVLAPVRDDD
jgi:DNA segregation ATPase FtsK/SpoIIIE, S-DNA-T family